MSNDDAHQTDHEHEGLDRHPGPGHLPSEVGVQAERQEEGVEAEIAEEEIEARRRERALHGDTDARADTTPDDDG